MLLGCAGLLLSLSLSRAGLGWAAATAGGETDVTGLGWAIVIVTVIVIVGWAGLGWATATAGGENYGTSLPSKVRTPQAQALFGEI